jgi:hypothetical protein
VRTTLTLDDDVCVKVKDEARRSGRPFKQIVNDLLRLALTLRRDPARARPFKVRPQPLGLRPGLEYDNIGDLLEQFEGPTHR